MAKQRLEGSETDTDIEDLDADELLKKLGDTRRKRKRNDDDERPGERYTSLSSDADSSSGSKETPHTSANLVSNLVSDFLDENVDEGVAFKEGMRSVRSTVHEEARSNVQATESRIRPVPSSNDQSKRSFADLGVSKALVSGLASMSIRHPTEVQAVCIPPLLAGRDCVGNAKTGSGKTIAFALPILQKLSTDPYGVFALVLTPTRELAFQISDQFAALGAPLNIQTAVIVGGMDMISQAIELNNRPHVIVATPGRIVDHLRSSNGEWNLSRIKFLVLDEADRLLTTTFSPELIYLFNVLPKGRQTCLFTATMTESIESLITAPPRPGKQKPFVHRMTASVETVNTLKQYYLLVPSHVRETYLYYILRNPPECIVHLRRAAPEQVKQAKKPAQTSHRKKSKTRKPALEDDPDAFEQPPPTIIFCARTRSAAYLTLLLQTLNIRAAALHSRLTQRARLNSLNLFRACVVPVLVTTDVGARGLDIDDVALVINWDVPTVPEEYTHRVGRTARRGQIGVAVSFVTERDENSVLKIENRIRTKLEEMTMPEATVLEKFNTVATAKRLANMELHDSDFGKREEVHKVKAARRERVEARRDAQFC